MTVNFDTDAYLKNYFKNAKRKFFQKGEIIIEGQAPLDNIFLVESGFVKTYSITDAGTYNLMTIKQSGDIMPLASLFDGGESRLYYQAMTDVCVSSVPKRQLEADIQADHELALAVTQKNLQLLRDYTSRLQNLEVSDARERVISRLLFLRRRFGAAAKDGREVIFPPVNHQDLADALNLTRETANRIVRQLVHEGLVAKSRDHMTIINLNKLSAKVSTSLGLRDPAHRSRP